MASYLTINPTTGAISLTSGKNSSATAYSYKIHAHLDFINYQPKDVYLTKTMTINKATFNTPTFTNPLLTSYMYNTSDSKTVTLSSLPPSTTVVYGLTDVSTGLSGYLQINSSGIISLSAGANYNATNYTYKITAQLTNSNYVTTTFTSQTYSLDITKSTALVAFDATVSGSLLLNVGYAQTSLTLGNNYSNPPPNTSFSYQKVNGDSRFTISGQTLTVATGLGSGNHTVTLTSTASNSNYVDKISATLTLVFRVGADINPTATGNYVAPAYNDGPNYAPSNPFIGAIGLRWSSPNNSVPYPNDSGHKNISSLTFNIVFGQNRIVTGFQLKARPQNE